MVVNAKRGGEEALRLVREASGSGVVVLADVATREGCRNVINTAVERFGGWTCSTESADLRVALTMYMQGLGKPGKRSRPPKT